MATVICILYLYYLSVSTGALASWFKFIFFYTHNAFLPNTDDKVNLTRSKRPGNIRVYVCLTEIATQPSCVCIWTLHGCSRVQWIYTHRMLGWKHLQNHLVLMPHHLARACLGADCSEFEIITNLNDLFTTFEQLSLQLCINI